MNREYRIGDLTIIARSRRTAERRARGFSRGEMDIDGKTVLAEERTPPGRKLKKRMKP